MFFKEFKLLVEHAHGVIVSFTSNSALIRCLNFLYLIGRYHTLFIELAFGGRKCTAVKAAASKDAQLLFLLQFLMVFIIEESLSPSSLFLSGDRSILLKLNRLLGIESILKEFQLIFWMALIGIPDGFVVLDTHEACSVAYFAVYLHFLVLNDYGFDLVIYRAEIVSAELWEKVFNKDHVIVGLQYATLLLSLLILIIIRMVLVSQLFR